jgi:nucleoside-diphosphate-sugar epimerase
MQKVIITGANGFIGSNVVNELIKNNITVIALDREGCNNNIPEGVRFVSLDLENISEIENLILDRDIDTFYHFAWAGSAGKERADASLQLKNAEWTVECVKLAKKIGCKRFVAAGSIMEQETISATYTQENRPGTGYIYGGGKLIAHCMSKSVAADLGIEHVWAIITNAYGEGEKSPRFVNTTIRKVINNEPLLFTAATQNYDFVHVADVAKAFYLIGENGLPFKEYVIGSSNAKPLKEFIFELKESLAPDKELIFGDIPFTGIDLPLNKFDCSTTEKDTGFKATITFGEGAKRTMEWITKEDKIV